MEDLATVLVVDDEPVMRTITQSILQQNGFEVITADSAEAAFQLIDEGLFPDIVLLDVLMPGLNGFQTCYRLRQQQRFEHLPIIMLTALDDQASIDEAYRSGATDFITKPLNIPLLPHRIRYLLRSANAFKEVFASRMTLLNTQHIAHLGNWTMDPEGNIVTASAQYLDIIGENSSPIPAPRLLFRVHREDRELLIQHRRLLQEGQPYRLDYRLRNLTDPNTWHHVHERGFPNIDRDGRYQGATGFTQDITERAQQEERIRDLAWHDRVTGLNNRGRLSELIEREIVSGRQQISLAVLYVHIASLREISTVFGQEVADSAIRVLSERLKELLHTPEKMCNCFDKACFLAAKLGRYDEHAFALAVTGVTSEEPIRCFANTILKHLSEPMILQGQETVFKVFLGIALYPQDAPDTPELIRRAMLCAMHAAAGDGSDPISFFDPEHDREAAERVALERGLRIALDQSSQLVPYFQPKVCAHTGQIVGAEVLLRWLHPERGMISPAKFIPIAEQSGLIHPISEWLVARICETIADWLAWKQEIGMISINLSAASFYQRTLIQFIDEVLQRTGIPGKQLVIELTEGVLLQNSDTASHVINALRERGIRISLDDFGTGFSSLGYLNRFNIDEIKIDRSFVIDIERDSRELALVQGIITLGHALGLKVVAEGVETARQAQLLREMGCDIFQGFLFAKPMPGDEFIRLPAQLSVPSEHPEKFS